MGPPLVLGPYPRLSYLGTLALCSIPPAKLKSSAVSLFLSLLVSAWPALVPLLTFRSLKAWLTSCHLSEILQMQKPEVTCLSSPSLQWLLTVPKIKGICRCILPRLSAPQKKKRGGIQFATSGATEMAWQVTERMGSVNDWREEHLATQCPASPFQVPS